MTTTNETKQATPKISNRSDIYESGYDLPTYLKVPLCPKCDRLYCYCPERYAAQIGKEDR